MNKQLVEFKTVQSEADIQIGEMLNTIPKDSLVKVKDTNHLWFNGVNLSKQYDISEDKVIKDIIKEDDKLTITFSNGKVDIIDLNHNHNILEINELQDKLNAKANVKHNHKIEDVDNLTNKLNSKAEKIHSHNISDVNDLQSELDKKALNTDLETFKIDTESKLNDKANKVHNHLISNITDLSDTLDSKSNKNHTHNIEDVDNLNTTLDEKASNLDLNKTKTDLESKINNKANTIHKHKTEDVEGLDTIINTINTGKVNTVKGKESISVTSGKDPVVSLKISDNKILTQSTSGLNAELSLNYDNGKLQLLGNNNTIIKEVDLGKHQIIESASLIDKNNATYLSLSFIGVDDTIEIDVSELIDIYEGKNSIVVSDNVISLKIAPDTINLVTDTNNGLSLNPIKNLIDNKSDKSHTHTFSQIKEKPTTISGYGITDAYNKTQSDSTYAIKEVEKAIKNITVGGSPVYNPNGITIPTIAGEKGPKGDTGARGPKGDKGDTGDSAYEVAVSNGFKGTEAEWLKSIQGKDGKQGIQGIQGIQGVQGEVGPRGLKGDKGDTGPKGADGKDGFNPYWKTTGSTILVANNGERDLKGPKGDTGAKGDKGDRGEKGLKGDTGPQGPKGNDGKDGSGVNIIGTLTDTSKLPPTGNKGDGYLIDGNLHIWNGSKWENIGNIKGPKGDKGDKGVQGDRGPQGNVGATGPKGDIGPQGPKGDRGIAGPPGKDGIDGKDGSKGDSGAQGPIGPQGPAGKDGINGKEGPQGLQGIQGLKGDPGPKGADGNQGPAGPKGEDFKLQKYTIEEKIDNDIERFIIYRNDDKVLNDNLSFFINYDKKEYKYLINLFTGDEESLFNIGGNYSYISLNGTNYLGGGIEDIVESRARVNCKEGIDINNDLVFVSYDTENNKETEENIIYDYSNSKITNVNKIEFADEEVWLDPSNKHNINSIASVKFNSNGADYGNYHLIFDNITTLDARSAELIIQEVNQISDERLKENIVRLRNDTDGLDLVKFTFKNDPNKKEHVGVLAQEIEKKYPNTVATSKDGTKSVNYTEFLLLELNKLRNEVSDMKKEINELKYGSKKS